MLKKVGFPLTNIFVMDGSKRSTKANAFFSGLGSKKNIVLFDTLVNEMSQDEITAVLAHEVGHYKKKHITKSIVISILQMGVMFFVFGWMAKSPLMADVLGAKENSFHLALITFSLLFSLFLWLPVFSVICIREKMNMKPMLMPKKHFRHCHW
jgi:STE24 endopeptidase